MNRLGIAFILLALLVSAILSGLVFKARKNKNQVAPVQHVLVATKSLNRGQIMSATDVRWQNWPTETLSPKYIVEGPRHKEDVIGSIVRVPINDGQPITDDLLIAKTNLSPLASVISPGKRAFTIKVTMEAALGGLVLPGDSVDVILTFSVSKQGSQDKAYVSRTILNNVSVLGVDQNLTPETVKTSTKSVGGAGNTKNVTLEVTPEQADLLATGAQMGTLSLSLTTPANTIGVMVPKTDDTSPGMLLIRGERTEQIGKSGT